MHRNPSSPQLYPYLTIFSLSAASLMFEVSLTRIFSVSQFYHFAFFIISLAMLGFGVSGTVLTLLPVSVKKNLLAHTQFLALACSVFILLSYGITNLLPFDSYTVTIDPRQIGFLAIHYSLLSTPFFFTGLVVGLVLSMSPESSGRIYSFNLLGSAFGCLLAVLLPGVITGEEAIIASSALAAIGALVLNLDNRKFRKQIFLSRLLSWGLPAVWLIMILAGISLRYKGLPVFPFLDLKISPYKSISYALQYPDAKHLSEKWNAFSRVDLISSSGIRSLPGLSYTYTQSFPSEDGIFIDGDNLSPLLNRDSSMNFAGFMPAAIAYQLHPGADVLVLDARAGLDAIIAKALGASTVSAVESNPLILQSSSELYRFEGIQPFSISSRSFLRSNQSKYDVIVFSLNQSFHPARSGAFSLGENYLMTVEAVQDSLALLRDDGLIIFSRWLQLPPSEWLRSFSMVVTSLEEIGLNPSDRIVAFRGYNLGTLLVKKSPFTKMELHQIDGFLEDKAFDITFSPGITYQDTNRFNILKESYYYQTFSSLIQSEDRRTWYQAFPNDVRPPRDTWPFFNHMFKGSQIPTVIAEFGKTWEPFGGAGFVLIILMLFLALILGGIFLILPAVWFWWRGSTREFHSPNLKTAFPSLFYFGAIGIAFLLVEIPLIQSAILVLDNPAYALATVLFALCFSSGIGSRFAHRFSASLVFPTLVILLFVLAAGFSRFNHSLLGLPLILRISLTILLLAPVGFFMGMPFPLGLYRMKDAPAHLIPWVWAMNGFTSVLSSFLGAIFDLTFGFTLVIVLSGVFYFLAGLSFPTVYYPQKIPPPLSAVQTSPNLS